MDDLITQLMRRPQTSGADDLTRDEVSLLVRHYREQSASIPKANELTRRTCTECGFEGYGPAYDDDTGNAYWGHKDSSCTLPWACPMCGTDHPTIEKGY